MGHPLPGPPEQDARAVQGPLRPGAHRQPGNSAWPRPASETVERDARPRHTAQGLTADSSGQWDRHGKWTGFVQARKTPSWPRSWANSSFLQLYSRRNAWANLDLLGQPDTSLAPVLRLQAQPQRPRHAQQEHGERPNRRGDLRHLHRGECSSSRGATQCINSACHCAVRHEDRQ
jgi:hypothetical protein